MSEDRKHKVKYAKPEAKDLGPVGPILGQVYPCQNGNSNTYGGCDSGNDNGVGICLNHGNQANTGCTFGNHNLVSCNKGSSAGGSFTVPRRVGP
jgi:hypothetical protein